MEKVKSFSKRGDYQSTVGQLEKKANQWIADHPNITVKEIKRGFSAPDDDDCVDDTTTYVDVHYVDGHMPKAVLVRTRNI